jgi:hypothetical protein
MEQKDKDIRCNTDKSKDNNIRYFCDGGLLSNTPLRELLQAHQPYRSPKHSSKRQGSDNTNAGSYLISTEEDVENWKKGFGFSLPSIMEKKSIGESHCLNISKTT